MACDSTYPELGRVTNDDLASCFDWNADPNYKSYYYKCRELFTDDLGCSEFIGYADAEDEIIKNVQKSIDRHPEESHRGVFAGIVIEAVYETSNPFAKEVMPFGLVSTETRMAIEEHNAQQYEKLDTLCSEAHAAALENRPWYKKLLNLEP